MPPIRSDETQPLPRRHRALFVSDLHLGALGCRADLILDFLRHNTAPVIYLVGDILDIWHPLHVHWSPAHDEILALLKHRADQGSRLVYLVGNHDAEMRQSDLRHILPAECHDSISHVTAKGEQLLVMHGDACDARVLRWHICTRIGSRADAVLRRLDRGLRRFGRSLAPGERSLVETVLLWVNAVLALGHGHETRLIDLARKTGHDGVVCGHFHVADLHSDHGLIYANCGDWVDSFTAIAEDATGHLAILGGRQCLAEKTDALPGGLPLPEVA